MSEIVDTIAKSAIIGSKTGFERFSSAAIAAGAVTLVTEFGDRTFFVTAILAAQDSKWFVWWGASLALWVQTIASSLLGAILHGFPSTADGIHIPFDDYIAGVSLIVFGLLSFHDAWKNTSEDNGQQEPSRLSVDSFQQLPNCPTPPPLHIINNDSTRDDAFYESPPPPLALSILTGEDGADSYREAKCFEDSSPSRNHPEPRDQASLYFAHEANSNKKNRSSLKDALLTADLSNDCRRFSNVSSRTVEEASRLVLREALRHGKRRVLIKAFSTVFVAEIGDRSMFSTIALAAAQNAYGVALGASLAHGLVTFVAVRSSTVISRFVSERVTQIIGGCLFLTLGILSIANGIVHQQFRQ